MNLTKSHIQVLSVLGGSRSLTLEEITESVSFTKHSSRVLSVLLELSDAGLARLHVAGYWMITPSGRTYCSKNGIETVEGKQHRGRGRYAAIRPDEVALSE